MKTYFKKTLVALLIPVIYYTFSAWYIKTGNTTEYNITNITTVANATSPIPNQKDFKIIIYNKSYVDYWLPVQTMEYNISNGYYNELGFNMLHNFGDSPGSIKYGSFGEMKSQDQLDSFTVFMNAVQAGGFKGLYSTVNMLRLCFAQRLVYEVNPVNGTYDVNNGFCYKNCYGEFRTDQGRTVIYASDINDATPRYIAKDIYENLQFGDLTNWAQEDAGIWHIKPMMRIDSTIVDNFPDKLIVKINIVNFAGDTIKRVDIKARNFAHFDFGSGTYIYNGSYIENFDFSLEPIGTDLTVPGGRSNESNVLNTGQYYDDWRNWETKSKVSFNVWWYGEADVWFDKMTVDDELANDLYSGIFDPEIKQEASAFTDNPSNYSFYTDEMSYSNIPCIEYVKGVMTGPGGNPNAQLHTAISNYHHIRGLKDNTIGHRELLKSYSNIGVKSVTLDAHTIVELKMPPQFNAGNMPDFTGNWFSANYNEYNESLQKRAFGDKYAITPENENDLSNKPRHEGSLVYQVNHARQQRNTYYPGIPMFVQPQMHSVLFYKNSTGKYEGGMREPTDEEIEAQAMISISHGADGIGWYIYQSFTEESTLNKFSFPFQNSSAAGTYYTYGLLNLSFLNYSKRTSNIFGQDKWDDMAIFQNKIKSWKSTLDAVTWQSGWSVHSEGAGHEFVTDIMSIDPNQPHGVQNSCVNDYQTSGYTAGPYLDCPNERYWELGFFNNVGSTKYFMAVNRRCVPANPPLSGDDRVIRIKFDANDFPNFTNWKITEVGNPSIGNEVVFSKNYNGYVNLGSTNGGMGWFKPGEGKLFKIEAVPVKGGILVADEDISGTSFTCEAPVYNNGHNITIGANTTIQFTDSSKFIMNGGVFTVGDQNTTGSQNITSDAVTGSAWNGHSFTNCEVKIYGATFSGLANDTTYAVNIIDCPVVDIRGCTFNSNNSLKGGINAVYYSSLNANITNIYIGGNTFTSSGSTIPTVNVSSYAGVTTPLIIENNTFTEGNTAIFLSGVTGGAVKGNTITDNYIGINALSSSIDISENTISSTLNSSTGIFASGGSEFKMNSSGSKKLGGLNNISSAGTGNNNINVDGSYFLLDGGQNVFNITDIQTSYHLYGYFPQLVSGPFDETNNCFNVSSSPVIPPYNLVTSGYQGSQITFNFSPYLTGCNPAGSQNFTVIDLGGGVYDTIYTGASGSGGSEKEVASVRRTDKQSTPAYTPQFAKEKYDSVCVLMRYRNYSQAKTKCLDLINTYPDSIQSLNTVSKLFLATVATDTTINGATQLKTFYENLILNNQSNTSLVKRANYYILKCKVRMRQFSQALAGFQQIINLNPYSYEGLIARWDYMATSLLMQGQGGGESSITNYELGITNDNQSDEFDKFDESGDDKNPFTKEQRQDIRKSINTAFEISKSDDETKMKTLEVKSDLGDVNASRELTQMKSLKQVVKTEKPKSITQHIKIVSEDIRKVFGTNTSGKGNQPKNLPTIFRLSQNYPNPFNPVTKINYDLPKDSKVNIVIYDILGREVKKLVNNEIKQPGSYIVDFNATDYASGVYFYRIEAEEPNGNKFVDSKKMVLLK